jgi:ubiquinone biosynthesis protein COQ9
MKKPPPGNKLAVTILALVAKHGWQKITHAQIAKTAKISLTDLRQRYPNKKDFLAVISRDFDERISRKQPEGQDTRDKLFDLLMHRFDLLQQHRTGIIAIMQAMQQDPALACAMLKNIRRSMRSMLQTAENKQPSLRDELRVAGLGTVYLYALYVWQGDTSRDMAKTMAALDRGLGYAAMAAKNFF